MIDEAFSSNPPYSEFTEIICHSAAELTIRALHCYCPFVPLSEILVLINGSGDRCGPIISGRTALWQRHIPGNQPLF